MKFILTMLLILTAEKALAFGAGEGVTQTAHSADYSICIKDFKTAKGAAKLVASLKFGRYIHASIVWVADYEPIRERCLKECEEISKNTDRICHCAPSPRYLVFYECWL